uniref:Uncharacterized protein n=1 Tax=viral metagenome TaxID=1070528 RepID=A0A6C0BP46_9ZZZZ
MPRQKRSIQRRIQRLKKQLAKTTDPAARRELEIDIRCEEQAIQALPVKSRSYKSSHSISASASRVASTTMKVSEEVTQTRRRIHTTTEKEVQRDIVEEKDGTRRIKEIERSKAVQDTFEEEVKRKWEHCLTRHLEVRTTVILREFDSDQARRNFRLEVRGRRRYMQTLPKVGFYKYLDLPVDQALTAYHRDWTELRESLGPLPQGLPDLHSRSLQVAQAYPHLSRAYRNYCEYIGRSILERKKEEAETKDDRTQHFGKRYLPLLDAKKYPEEYILTHYAAEYDDKARAVKAMMQGFGMHARDASNEIKSQHIFQRVMAGMPSPQEILDYRKHQEPYQFSTDGPYLGYSGADINRLYPEYEPCLDNRLRLVEWFEQGRYDHLETLVLSMYVIYNASLHPENLAGLRFDQLQDVGPSGLGSIQWTQAFDGYPREWTRQAPRDSELCHWASQSVILPSGQLASFEAPLWYLPHLFPPEDHKDIQLDLKQAARRYVEMEAQPINSYEPTLRLTQDLVVPARLKHLPEFQWLGDVDEGWIQRAPEVTVDEAASAIDNALEVM